MTRALRFAGLLPHVTGGGSLTPELLMQMRALVHERRGGGDGFEIVVEGTTPTDDPAAASGRVRPWADAGATWWIESDWESFDPAGAHRRIAAGPPMTRG